MIRDLVVVGAGGHSKVAIDSALRGGGWRIVGLFADGDSHPRSVLGFEVLGDTDRLVQIADQSTHFIVAIGSNTVRERLQQALTAAGLKAATLIHPAAVIAQSATVGAGTVVLANAAVNPDARIGRGVIVNTGAVVDHDCVLGDFCHIAPGAKLCGSVSVGARSLIGAGAVVIPGVAIGCDCVVAAGAVVIAQAPDSATLAGVPAHPI